MKMTLLFNKPQKKQVKSGINELIKLAYAGETEHIESQLKKGADPNVCDESGNTPLLIATSRNDLATVKVLLEYNARANVKNAAEYTPLLNAELHKNDEMIKQVKNALSKSYSSILK
jgi:ankyrin repeat protein